MTLRAPFPWFGGKSRSAKLIWQRLGTVDHYVEPFAGSLAVLLQAPEPAKLETVNDVDGWLVNFWRSVKHDPFAVLEHARDPVTELDLHARNEALIRLRKQMTEWLRADPEWHLPKAAGWWAWGISQWIGRHWAQRSSRQKPITRLCGLNRRTIGAEQWLLDLHERLRRVVVLCGDWQRCVTRSTLNVQQRGHSMGVRTVGILLDPPYAKREVVYGDVASIAHDVRAWAVEHGADARYRIALCTHGDDEPMPDGWSSVTKTEKGGYGNAAGRQHRDAIHFSPGCLTP